MCSFEIGMTLSLLMMSFGIWAILLLLALLDFVSYLLASTDISIWFRGITTIASTGSLSKLRASSSYTSPSSSRCHSVSFWSQYLA